MADIKTENEQSARKRKRDYHLMLFVDNEKGEIQQMGIGRIFIEVLAAVIVIILAVAIVGWSVNAGKRKTAEAEVASLTKQIEEMNVQIADLSAENSELSNKVTILSETVNTKVEKENSIQKESDAAHMPEGFPLSASASMSTDEEDPNTVRFTCSEGASIIAAGAGTVIETIPDNDYGYCVRIDHGNGYVSEYYGSAVPLVKNGDEVIQGSILAMVEGKDAKLAYKIFLDDKPVDPMTIIKIDG